MLTSSSDVDDTMFTVLMVMVVLPLPTLNINLGDAEASLSVTVANILLDDKALNSVGRVNDSVPVPFVTDIVADAPHIIIL